MQRFMSPLAMVAALQPDRPVYCVRPHVVSAATRWFLDHFQGRVLFAVKTNPSLVATIAAEGLQHFDVASLREMETVHDIAPDARMSYMHPVKSRGSIRQAYFKYGIRDYSLDTREELNKILEETNYATDLNLFVRLAVSNRHSNFELTGKFGTTGKEASSLLFATRQVASNLGICFHAGSQLMNPQAFAEAMRHVAHHIGSAGVIVDILDVGGGFPSIYPGQEPPGLINYINSINESFEQMPVSENCELWCEPGRALVAEAVSLVVQVDLRKDNRLYINDGTYGGLFDAGQPAFVFAASRILTTNLVARESGQEFGEFSLYGPTCDSLDFMPGPFLLPADIDEGDYIEIAGLGAYSESLRTGFNGFDSHHVVQVDEGPMMSMYGLERLQPNRYGMTNTIELTAIEGGQSGGEL